MNEGDKKFYEIWSSRRQKGKWNYVIRKGFFYVLWQFATYAFLYSRSNDPFPLIRELMGLIFVMGLLAVGLGWLFARLDWQLKEEKYHNIEQHYNGGYDEA